MDTNLAELAERKQQQKLVIMDGYCYYYYSIPV